jgi:hypothetical protein
MADLDNNGRRLKEQKPVSSRKTGNGFTAAQSAWQMEALNSHNSFRARHRVPPLELDDQSVVRLKIMPITWRKTIYSSIAQTVMVSVKICMEWVDRHQ